MKSTWLPTVSDVFKLTYFYYISVVWRRLCRCTGINVTINLNCVSTIMNHNNYICSAVQLEILYCPHGAVQEDKWCRKRLIWIRNKLLLALHHCVKSDVQCAMKLPSADRTRSHVLKIVPFKLNSEHHLIVIWI